MHVDEALGLQRVLDVVDGFECHSMASEHASVEGREGAPDWLAIGGPRMLQVCDVTAINVQPQHSLCSFV